ncbi:MAG: T9SS type A sorting domain-containing protein, partial [candidate division KSB1 bacterium]
EIGYAKSVSDSSAIVEAPASYFLAPNYPNPFKHSTRLQYGLPTRAEVTLAVYDILGRNIKTLVQRVEEAGIKFVTWEGTDELGRTVSAGLYVCQLRAGDFVQTRKLVRVE